MHTMMMHEENMVMMLNCYVITDTPNFNFQTAALYMISIKLQPLAIWDDSLTMYVVP